MKSAKADLSKRVDESPDRDKNPATEPAKSSIDSGGQRQPAEINAVGQTTGDSWFVQVGSYPERKTADRIAKKLSDKGYDTLVVADDIRGKKQHRVRVGRLASRAEAEKLQRVLRDKENLSRTIVAK